MPGAPPARRVYRCHHFDSTRWDHFRRRPGDIVIATSYKAGTTWTQAIVAHLLFWGQEMPGPPAELSPWLDFRLVPLEVVVAGLEAQPHRRFLKSHLPLDGLPYDPELRYLYVARDGRDVFMSLWNHTTHLTEETFALMNAVPGREGEPFPPPPDDLHEFFRGWISRGLLPGETDGWPYWSHLANVRSWWEHRELENIELVHFADLLARPEEEIRRIAGFLGVELPEEAFAAIAEAVSFDAMRRQGDRYVPGGGQFWRGGAASFLHRGTNGRWRGVLTEDELARYDELCERSLPPDCRAWLEHGRAARGPGA